MYGQNSYSQYPYTGYGYSTYGQRPYLQPQQPMAQPQMQQVQQPMQPTLPTLCYAKMEEAKPFIITSANSSMLFIDRDKNKALLKMTDNVCNSYSRYFDISETDENGNPLQRQEQTNPQVDYGQFVRKNELDGFVTLSQYNELLGQFNDLKNMLQNAKTKQAENKPLTSDFNGGKGNTQPNK